LPRGWFDIALGWPDPEIPAFVEPDCDRATASWCIFRSSSSRGRWRAAAALCALPAAARAPPRERRSRKWPMTPGSMHPNWRRIFRRGAYTATCWVQGGDGDWLIEHVATLTAIAGADWYRPMSARNRRRKGRGYARASISFLIGNEAAEEVSRAGFAFAEEKRDPASKRLPERRDSAGLCEPI